MDLLFKLEECVNIIHNNINNYNILIDFIKIRYNLFYLDKIKNKLKEICKKIKHLQNFYKNKYVLLKSNSYKILNKSFPDINYDKVKITNDIKIDAIEVNSIKDIPNSRLYWINDINQFAVKINGVLLRGNIGNIYNKKCICESNNTQMSICKNYNACKTLLNNKVCKFYHDPLQVLDLLKQGIIEKNTYEKYKNFYRNFSNTSWIYTNLTTNRNLNMRHYGSRDNLRYELNLLELEDDYTRKKILENYYQQTMHDLLITLITHEKNDKKNISYNYNLLT